MKYFVTHVLQNEEYEETKSVANLVIMLLKLLLENLILISHTIPMSIYVAIEVLKWLQVRAVYADYDLMIDPGDLSIKRASNLHSETKNKEKEMFARNMVKITNTEVIENLGKIDLCICDKTGTLTKNELLMKELYTDSTSFKIKYQSDTVDKND